MTSREQNPNQNGETPELSTDPEMRASRHWDNISVKLTEWSQRRTEDSKRLKEFNALAASTKNSDQKTTRTGAEFVQAFETQWDALVGYGEEQKHNILAILRRPLKARALLLDRSEKSLINLVPSDVRSEFCKFSASDESAEFGNRTFQKGIDFSMSDISGVNFHGSKLPNSCFVGATCSHTRFGETVLDFSNFNYTDLENANFSDARIQNVDFYGANLRRVDFSNADLRNSKGILFDECVINGTRFSHAGNDPWSVLRRTYTGSRFFIHVLLLLVVMAPYLGKAVFWSSINKAQAVFVETQGYMIDTIASHQQVLFASIENMEEDTLGHDLSEVNLKIEELKNKIRNVGPCLKKQENCRRTPLWKLLLGLDGIGFQQFLVIGLLLYNILRLLLTWRVSSLRDEELRTEISPAFGDYRWLYAMHLVFSMLWVAAIGSAIHSVYYILTTSIALPI